MGARRRTPVLVGRRAPLDALEAALDRVDGRSGELVLISGEAGMGKTRLVQDFASGADVLSVVGGCVDFSTEAAAYAGWTELLHSLVRELGVELFAAQRTQLARLLAEFGEAAAESDDGQALLFEAVVGALECAAAHRRLAFVIDDVHWIDPASRDLLMYVARNLRRLPILLVVTTRPKATAEHRELVAQLSRLDAERIELDRLSEVDTADVASLLLGAEPDAPEVVAIVARADGNPLFVEELVASLGTEGLPPTVRDVMLSRFNALGRDARDLVLIAAIVGARSPRALLARATKLSAERARAAAREVVDAGVLIADSDGRSYSFAHALLREAVLGEMLPDDRAMLHAAVAGALVELGSLEGDLDIVAELARHYDAAECPDEALRWSVAAAGQAYARYAFATAHALYERALVWWRRVSDPSEVAGPRTDLLFGAADAAGAAGRLERAAELAAQAIDLATEPVAAAEAFTRAESHLWAVGRLSDIDELANRALSHLDELDDATRLHFLLRAGRAAILDQRPEAALALVPPIIDVEDFCEPELVVDAHLVYGMSFETLGDSERAAAELHAAADVARKHKLWPRLGLVLYNDAAYLSSVPRLRECLARLDEVDDVVNVHGIRRFLVASATLRADTLSWLGDLDGARAAALPVADVAMEGGERDLVAYSSALIEWLSGAYEDAVRTLEKAGGTPGAESQWALMNAWIRADALAWLGNLDAAAHVVAETLPIMQDRFDPYWQGFLTMAGVRVEADRRLAGRSDAGFDLASQERIAALLATWGSVTRDAEVAFPLTRAQAFAVEAELARASRTGAATAALHAAGAFADLEMSYYVAYFEWRAAEAMIAARDRQSPAALLTQARDRAMEHGFGGLERAVKRTARAEQVRLTPRGTTGDGMLTGREVEVLRLLAEGLSNQEIADKLVIGHRTVRTHVSNILQKLGAGTRAEAVTVAHRRDLV